MLIQLLVNGFIAGSMYSLIAISFFLIYKSCRFFHFAHAVVFTSGAYFTLIFKNLGCNLFFAIFISVICSSFIGCMMDIFIYRSLRQKNATYMILLLTSLGIYISLQNVISMIFGDEIKSIRSWEVREGINFLGARITPIQILIIGINMGAIILIWTWVKYTKLGKVMRAVSNDPDLANISGIYIDGVILLTFAIGSAFAGISGILSAFETDITPTMGMNALMIGVVAVIIGGVGSIPGVVLGAFLIGFSQNLGVWKISSQWQDAIAFIILFVFLLFKPEGFLGKKIKKAKI